MQLKLIILGAGINGLSCAFRLSVRYPEAQIVIVSEKFRPNTTSDVAAGLWEPYLNGNTSHELLRKWSRDTYEYFHQLWKSGRADECGISLIPIISCSDSTDADDIFWKDFVFSFRELDKKQLEQLGHEHEEKYRSGVDFITFTCEPTKLMKVYTEALKSRGVKFIQKKIDIGGIQDLAKHFPSQELVVINCLGLGNRALLNDHQIGPCRGQVRRIEAPWMFHVLINDSTYVIPNTGCVTMGGTKQMDDYDLQSREQDAEAISRGCSRMIPALQLAPTKGDFVGLRPLREAVRLEVEWIQTENGERLPVIHNYGHGGCGITLSWGCAGEVLRLAHEVIAGFNSKL